MTQPSLRPQDVVILAKLLTHEGARPSFAQMGLDLSMSSSEAHASLKRLGQARLVVSDARGTKLNRRAIAEFIVHGVKYAFPAKRGEMTRGVPTSYAAPPLSQRIVAGREPPPVWPHPEGSTRGVALEPLYRSVPAAALRDAALYELLALIDALRDGRVRERMLAEQHLGARIVGKINERSKPQTARTRG